jgi:TBC domain-containing protein kinase-like protein
MTRLVSFFEPKIYLHFADIGFQHDFYLVRWIMTLFTHILNLPQVCLLWTHLFTHRVEFLFFFAVALLRQLREPILGSDLNVVLVLLVSPAIAQKVDVSAAIKEALVLLQKCPLSFILSGDYTVDVQA